MVKPDALPKIPYSTDVGYLYQGSRTGENISPSLFPDHFSTFHERLSSQFCICDISRKMSENAVSSMTTFIFQVSQSLWEPCISMVTMNTFPTCLTSVCTVSSIWYVASGRTIPSWFCIRSWDIISFRRPWK